jgi:hypothetical protein
MFLLGYFDYSTSVSFMTVAPKQQSFIIPTALKRLVHLAVQLLDERVHG